MFQLIHLGAPAQAVCMHVCVAQYVTIQSRLFESAAHIKETVLKLVLFLFAIVGKELELASLPLARCYLGAQSMVLPACAWRTLFLAVGMEAKFTGGFIT